MRKIKLRWFVKGKGMHPFDRWKAILSKDLLELQQLHGQDASTRLRRLLKEQELGQHCCEAGENLSDFELSLLKMELGLDEQGWHAYKSKVRPPRE